MKEDKENDEGILSVLPLWGLLFLICVLLQVYVGKERPLIQPVRQRSIVKTDQKQLYLPESSLYLIKKKLNDSLNRKVIIMTKTFTIHPLSYTNFTNREFESLMVDTGQLLEVFAKAHKDEPMYGKHLDSFKSKLADFQGQLAIVEKKEATNLTEVDRNRDSALVGLFTLHRGFAKIKETKLKEAHETLKPVFAKYEDITKHSNDVETAEIKSLLKTLSEEPYRQQLPV